MNDAVITTERLSKQYRIGAARQSYYTLRDDIVNGVRGLFQRNGRNRAESNAIWALKDVSIEVKRGEVIGLIGRNGAGKSTILKILSRITDPSSGQATICGRVGSLLEVGTGFHPELTGRENVYMSGALLGMTKRETDRKFDEIVAFAEVEKFIGTPVKRYSSGMHMRLAFAVAAHLETEVLLVDEVLAVGDAGFQRKCLGKMGNVCQEGRTILFVSHNMAAIQSLCSRVVWLNGGRVEEDGVPKHVIQSYLQSFDATEAVPLHERIDRGGDGAVRFVSLKIETASGESVIRCNSRLKFTLGYRGEEPLRYGRFLISINDFATSTGLYLCNTEAVGGIPESLPPEGIITCITDPINLTPGRCFVNLALFKAGVMTDHVEHASDFDVESEDMYGSGQLPPREWVVGVLKHQWSVDGSGTLSDHAAACRSAE